MKRMGGIFVLILVLVLPCFAFGGRDKVDAAKFRSVTVVGQIGVYGNEPHTWLGFVDQKGVEYALDAPADILEQLRNMQGFILEVTGKLDEMPKGQPVGLQVLSGGTIHVEEFKTHPLES